jgi:two-component system, NtrC family, nitrogen regulation sensor histidine kinase NtrY
VPAVDTPHELGEPAVVPASDRLLELVLDASPEAVVLVGETGTLVYANAAARELFFAGRDVLGQNLLHMLAGAAEALRSPLLSGTDQIFTHDPGDDSGPGTFHVATRRVEVDGAPHTLITVRTVTDEIAAQENAVLKRTLRVIGHELANSMTPAASLLRSAQQLLALPDQQPRVVTALRTVEERLVHLHGFLAGLAALGQLPRPTRRDVAWPAFLDGLRALWPGVVIAAGFDARITAPGWFDPAQVQQVLINLIKNAHEAGGPPDAVTIEVAAGADGVRFTVADRGSGMADDVLRNALVPAFTTKEHGSGMGLPLCREIVHAHDGRLRIARRDGGGTAVSFWLPSRTPSPSASRTRLTLTR